MEKQTTISLELLLLNDLLNNHVIDKDLYDKAIRKIDSSANEPKAA